jgi:hypothetical protein
MIHEGIGRNGSIGSVNEETMSPDNGKIAGRRAIEIIVGLIAVLIVLGVLSSLI